MFVLEIFGRHRRQRQQPTVVSVQSATQTMPAPQPSTPTSQPSSCLPMSPNSVPSSSQHLLTPSRVSKMSKMLSVGRRKVVSATKELQKKMKLGKKNKRKDSGASRTTVSKATSKVEFLSLVLPPIDLFVDEVTTALEATIEGHFAKPIPSSEYTVPESEAMGSFPPALIEVPVSLHPDPILSLDSAPSLSSEKSESSHTTTATSLETSTLAAHKALESSLPNLAESSEVSSSSPVEAVKFPLTPLPARSESWEFAHFPTLEVIEHELSFPAAWFADPSPSLLEVLEPFLNSQPSATESLGLSFPILEVVERSTPTPTPHSALVITPLASTSPNPRFAHKNTLKSFPQLSIKSLPLPPTEEFEAAEYWEIYPAPPVHDRLKPFPPYDEAIAFALMKKYALFDEELFTALEQTGPSATSKNSENLAKAVLDLSNTGALNRRQESEDLKQQSAQPIIKKQLKKKGRILNLHEEVKSRRNIPSTPAGGYLRLPMPSGWPVTNSETFWLIQNYIQAQELSHVEGAPPARDFGDEFVVDGRRWIASDDELVRGLRPKAVLHLNGRRYVRADGGRISEIDPVPATGEFIGPHGQMMINGRWYQVAYAAVQGQSLPDDCILFQGHIFKPSAGYQLAEDMAVSKVIWPLRLRGGGGKEIPNQYVKIDDYHILIAGKEFEMFVDNFDSYGEDFPDGSAIYEGKVWVPSDADNSLLIF